MNSGFSSMVMNNLSFQKIFLVLADTFLHSFNDEFNSRKLH